MAVTRTCDRCQQHLDPDGWVLIDGDYERDGLRLSDIHPDFNLRIRATDVEEINARIDLCLECLIALLQS